MRTFLTFISLTVFSVVSAANSIAIIDKVTEPVKISDDVDYHITSGTPFTSSGTIDIINTDHAVVVLDSLYPTQALKWLSYIKINGVKANNNVNCQVKLYNRGSIILPYGNDVKMLTVFSEENYGGQSCNEFGTENNGGFMVTLTEEKLNNRIKSFKLKRGYMVTFAIGANGRGYSRCFIAASEDLEVPSLPPILSGRISSYRVFKWYDTSKVAIAEPDGSLENCRKLHATSTYRWGVGDNLQPDVECVAHQNQQGTSAASLGRVTFTCHMKADNEPLNGADPGQTDLQTILKNWPALMATGLRLCTPSSWDGSDYWNGTGFIKTFLDSIDARGWRCDIVDVHSYWGEGNFNNLQNWVNNMHRPIWISEWVWGASWSGSSGIFAEASSWDNPTDADLRLNKTVVERICNNLNKMDYVERYFYWNYERNCSKLIMNGKLTPAGEMYSKLNSGLGYNGKYDYIPRTPKVKTPTDLSATYVARTNVLNLAWNEPNPELLDSIYIEVKKDNGFWEYLCTVPVDEGTNEYSHSLSDISPGIYFYRIVTIGFDGKKRQSHETIIVLDESSQIAPSDDLGIGTITTSTSADSYSFFAIPYEKNPVIVFGSVSNRNANAALVERVQLTNFSDHFYRSFRSNIQALTYGTRTDFYLNAQMPDYTSYLTANQGTGFVGGLRYEAMITQLKAVGDTIDITFAEPFQEAPVVMATPIYAFDNYPLLWRIFDVTPTGCRAVMERQYALDIDSKTVSKSAKLNIFAIEKGKVCDEDGNTIIVGDTLLSFTSPTSFQDILFNDSLENPKVLVQLQTRNRNCAGNLRTQTVGPDPTKTSVRLQLDYSNNTNKLLTNNKSADEIVGWIAVGRSLESATGIGQSTTSGNSITISMLDERQCVTVCDNKATNASLLTISGQSVERVRVVDGKALIDISSLPSGIYIVCTDTHKCAKIIKR